jgi:ribonuclease P/MRP protein subunit POP5
MARAGSLRKRYISFELRMQPSPDAESLKKALYSEALRFFGEYGLSSVALKLVEFDAGKGILRCERKHLDDVLGFLALLDSLDGRPARLVSRKSSGTIAGLEAG